MPTTEENNELDPPDYEYFGNSILGLCFAQKLTLIQVATRCVELTSIKGRDPTLDMVLACEDASRWTQWLVAVVKDQNASVPPYVWTTVARVFNTTTDYLLGATHDAADTRRTDAKTL